MTPCEKLGYKAGDEFEVHTIGAVFEEGDVIVLFDDDGSDCPEFNYIDGREGTGFIHLSRVRPLPITLRKGDYCSTANMTESEYHAVAAAFMAAGAEDGEYPDGSFKSEKHFGWCDDDAKDLLHSHALGHAFKRHLTISQVLNATNAQGKTPQQGPKSMTVIDTLHEAKRQRDEAAEKLAAAEAVLNVALDAVRAELGEGFDLNMSGAQPAEDMTDPANWRAGDVIKAVENSIDLTKGREYVIKRLDSGGDPAVEDDLGDVEERDKDYFTFVRRP